MPSSKFRTLHSSWIEVLLLCRIRYEWSEGSAAAASPYWRSRLWGLYFTLHAANETLIASESEEEDPGDEDEEEEPKRDFSKDEDSVIWMTIQELGVKLVVLDELSDVLGIKSEEIEPRYGMLLEDFAKNGRIPVGTSRNGVLLTESKRIVVTRSASKETSKVYPGRRKISALQKSNAFCLILKRMRKMSRKISSPPWTLSTISFVGVVWFLIAGFTAARKR